MRFFTSKYHSSLPMYISMTAVYRGPMVMQTTDSATQVQPDAVESPEDTVHLVCCKVKQLETIGVPIYSMCGVDCTGHPDVMDGTDVDCQLCVDLDERNAPGCASCPQTYWATSV